MATIHRTAPATTSASRKKSSTPAKPRAKKAEEFIVIKEEEIPLNFYAVRSKDGKWFRSKGYDYSGMNSKKSWVDNIVDAKIYAKPGPAKAQVTFWATNYPQFGVPDLVQITVGKCIYLDQEDRVKKVQHKKAIENTEYEIRKFEMLQTAHMQKVKAYRGDGKDKESIRIESNLRSLRDKLQKLKEK